MFNFLAYLKKGVCINIGIYTVVPVLHLGDEGFKSRMSLFLEKLTCRQCPLNYPLFSNDLWLSFVFKGIH